MTKMPKISIIIPVYNVEEYIEDCLLSVMRQTYTGGMECILIDDCGNDHSIDIAQNLISEYKGSIVFRILHHECNRGLSAARNTGTVVASGDYIYYLDSDDYMSSNCIELLAAPIQEKEYDIIIGDYEMFGERKDPTLLRDDRQEIIGNEQIFESFADLKIYVMAWNKLCKLSFLRNNNILFLEGQLHEDNLWTYKTVLYAQTLKIVHDVVYYYRVRANSIATDDTKAQLKVSSYADTIEYIQKHTYHIVGTYAKCLIYYWRLYLFLAQENHHDFYGEYRQLRKSFPLKPVTSLMRNEVSPAQFRSMWHIMLPPRIAYYCMCLRGRWR